MSTAYRSIYSGQEIDEAIAAMKASNGLMISNDFLGGANKAASAEIAKILDARLDVFEDPIQLRAVIDAIPDSNILTDAYLYKIDHINSDFKGLFNTIGDRNAALAQATPSFTGNEVCVVMNNGFGYAEFQRWDAVGALWRRIKLFGLGEFDAVTVPTASTISLFSFGTASFNTMKVLVSVGTSDKTQRHIQEVVVSAIGTDVYLSIYGEMGNAQLFTVSTTLVNNVVTLNITTTASDLKVTAKQIALI